MLREYEITMIANPQLSEEGSRELFEKYETMILADGGEVVRKSDWGTRKMAFPIGKHFRGHYMHYDLTAKSENLQKAERLMRIDESVLRCLSVKVGENINVDDRKAELAKLEAQAAAQKESNNNLKERGRP